MSKIEISKDQRRDACEALRKYMSNEFDFELEQFDGEFLFDFILQRFGPLFYNQGVNDSQKIIERKMADIADELYEIEQVIPR